MTDFTNPRYGLIKIFQDAGFILQSIEQIRYNNGSEISIVRLFVDQNLIDTIFPIT